MDQGRVSFQSSEPIFQSRLRPTDPDGMLVTLFTGGHQAEFYGRFGFSGPESLDGMSLRIERHPGPQGDGANGEAQ